MKKFDDFIEKFLLLLALLCTIIAGFGLHGALTSSGNKITINKDEWICNKVEILECIQYSLLKESE